MSDRRRVDLVSLRTPARRSAEGSTTRFVEGIGLEAMLSELPNRVSYRDPRKAGQFERDMLSERVRSDLAAARARGRKLGRQTGDRPKSDRHAPKVLSLDRERPRPQQEHRRRDRWAGAGGDGSRYQNRGVRILGI